MRKLLGAIAVPLPRLRPHIRRGYHCDPGITGKRRQHHGKCAAEACHPKTEFAFAWLAHGMVYLDKVAPIL